MSASNGAVLGQSKTLGTGAAADAQPLSDDEIAARYNTRTPSAAERAAQLATLKKLRAKKSAARLAEERRGAGAPVRVYAGERLAGRCAAAADALRGGRHTQTAFTISFTLGTRARSSRRSSSSPTPTSLSAVRPTTAPLCVCKCVCAFWPHSRSTAVCDDTVTHALKGRTVMTGAQRAESVRHCKVRQVGLAEQADGIMRVIAI